MEKRLFYIDSLNQEFEGYWTKRRWNGWEIPLFEIDEVKKIMNALRLSGTDAYYDEASDAFIVEDEHDISDKTIIQGEKQKVEGEELILYEVGNGWTWELSNP
ncbi:hypothetical protein A6395_15365 [Exiguobacterium sp. SH31]|uniref:hypothetical protein n=1 Tax=Exiguobacterium sp. SH31 TaxID=1843183 RepID=UPI0008CF0A14|nr:hypothetical protein [Exiguobacterium sp. SH31]OGX77787.1 hypothetical protein A6395_15365 [Exiguobacterium sp. SH31]